MSTFPSSQALTRASTPSLSSAGSAAPALTRMLAAVSLLLSMASDKGDFPYMSLTLTFAPDRMRMSTTCELPRSAAFMSATARSISLALGAAPPLYKCPNRIRMSGFGGDH